MNSALFNSKPFLYSVRFRWKAYNFQYNHKYSSGCYNLDEVLWTYQSDLFRHIHYHIYERYKQYNNNNDFLMSVGWGSGLDTKDYIDAQEIEIILTYAKEVLNLNKIGIKLVTEDVVGGVITASELLFFGFSNWYADHKEDIIPWVNLFHEEELIDVT